MSNNQNQSFLDPKTITAIILSAGVFLAWNSWMRNKYPHLAEDKAKVEAQAEDPSIKKDNIKNPSRLAEASVAENQDNIKSGDAELVVENLETTNKEEKLYHFENEVLSFDVSSKGMGLKNISLKKYLNREKSVFTLGSNNSENLPFSTNIMGRSKPVDFAINQTGKNTFEGVASVNGLRIIKIMEVKGNSYAIDTTVKVDGKTEDLVGVTAAISEGINQTQAGGMLSADRFNIQEFFIDYGTDNDERERITKEEKINLPFNNVNIASIGSQYFALALLNKSDVMPKVEATTNLDSQTALLKFYFNVLNKNEVFNVSYSAFLGPKSLPILESANENLARIIDYGFFGAIARVMQRVLDVFYEFTGNWGFAIILLTVVVRLLVLPTALSSYKSMKNMSKISPLLKDIKEKYKDDAHARNQAMMELYKTHKINPVGGCLPMLLQMPVFFALYQVLGQSIDLYQTPFILWIQDLSAKDPYYVLPILMGVTMFVQTKISPTTMEPAQQRIMLIMPLVFSFMMMSLPAGLTLYIFVSGLFGIFQQLYFTRDKQPKGAAA